MISFKLFFSALFISIPGFIAGCSAQDSGLSASGSLPTHKQVSGLDQQILHSKSLLLVGLEPYLGRGTTFAKSAQPLRLKSAGKPLLLKDANGLAHKSSEINIAWREVPLAHSLKLGRQVVGPFASFESAQRMALSLQNIGIPVQIAHPKDWELWLPQGVKVPKGLKFVAWNKTVNSEIKAVLKGLTGELLLSGPIKIEAPDGLQLNNGVFWGPFWLKADSYGSWTLIEEVPLERYLLGVVPYEIGSGAPKAALAAQAVLARTWALANSHRFSIDGYHLCSDTQCQVYKDPRRASERVRNAISNTSGKYLTWKKKPIHAVYHASNGGVMASGNEAWSMTPLPYLKAQLDGSRTWTDRFDIPLKTSSGLKELLQEVEGAYGNSHSRFRWTRTFKAEDLKNLLLSFKNAKALPSHVRVLERGDSGRVIALEIVSEENQLQRVLRLDQIRRVLGNLPSTLFVVKESKPGTWQFSGGGFGHGAGLSQAGAIDLATRGWKTSKILSHYYPGTTYGTLQDLPKAP